MKVCKYLLYVGPILVFCSRSLIAQYSDFDSYQGVLARQDLEAKLPYLGSRSVLDEYISITDESLRIYSSSANKQADRPEFVLRLGTQSHQTQRPFEPDFSSPKPLQGLRVAIDPGHLGGDMAIVEERFVDLNLGVGVDGKPIRLQFNEGTLAVVTAKLLQQLLQEQGATVMLTKDKPGQAAYQQQFDAWCKQTLGIASLAEWQTPAGQKKAIAYLREREFTPTQRRDLDERLLRIERSVPIDKARLLQQTVFRLGYNMLDLQARAAKINAFHPNMTLVIHFNAVGSGTVTTDVNYNMTFVAGSFLLGELTSQRARYELIRLLVSNDLTESIALSGAIAKHMEKTLAVPLVGEQYSFGGSEIFVTPGVFCRNLVLTRCVHGVLCYGETLIQHNTEEAYRLAKKDIVVDGIPTTSRVVEVAQAYFQGICQYFGLN